jgi:hypothetical protein
MWIRNAAGAVLLAASTTHAGTGTFENLRASGNVMASATGTIVGERFDVPAATTTKAGDDLDVHPLSGAIDFAPTLGPVSGGAGGSFNATVIDNVLKGAAGAGATARATPDAFASNDILVSASSSMTLSFTLARTVAADLHVALRRVEGYATVRTTLSGPTIQPIIEMERTGDIARTMILPAGDYHLTFTQLAAAGTESASSDPKAESRGTASFSLAVDPCGADCNGDNKVDLLDFICFQQRVKDQVEIADLNDDGRVDVLDMFVFHELFLGGCD